MENTPTSSAHTPGPWSLDDEQAYGGGFLTATVRADRCPSIACVYHLGTPVGRSNANLIAAAPELLEACHALFSVLCDTDVGETPDGELDGRQLQALNLYNTATAKAYGNAA